MGRPGQRKEPEPKWGNKKNKKKRKKKNTKEKKEKGKKRKKKEKKHPLPWQKRGNIGGAMPGSTLAKAGPHP